MRLMANYFQSTPSGRRATVYRHSHTLPHIRFSIHALRAESDKGRARRLRQGYDFQSTPSGRRATPYGLRSALRVMVFNPRPPGGERLQKRRKILFFAKLGWRISNYIFILLHFLPDEKEFFYFFPLFLLFFPII